VTARPASPAADLAAWDRSYADAGATRITPEQLIDLAHQLEQARAAGADDDAVDRRLRRLADLGSLYSLGQAAGIQRCLRWLVILLSLILPSGLVAAIYGMNFEPHASPWSMPELLLYWGYPAVLLIMLGLMLLGLLLLRRARWLLPSGE
jgi:hypothetical protein